MRKLLVTIEDSGGYRKPTKETLATFMRAWLLSAKSRTRPSTWATYETLTEKHIVPSLGGVQLHRLNTAQLNAFCGTLLESGRLQHKGGLSPRTVGHIHGVLRLALGEAVRWEW